MVTPCGYPHGGNAVQRLGEHHETAGTNQAMDGARCDGIPDPAQPLVPIACRRVSREGDQIVDVLSQGPGHHGRSSPSS